MVPPCRVFRKLQSWLRGELTSWCTPLGNLAKRTFLRAFARQLTQSGEFYGAICELCEVAAASGDDYIRAQATIVHELGPKQRIDRRSSAAPIEERT